MAKEKINEKDETKICPRCKIERDDPVDIKAIELWGYCTLCDALDGEALNQDPGSGYYDYE